MKRIILCAIILVSGFNSLPAEEPAGNFYISKVNKVEKQWVIPPDRRGFMGMRGITKFDYARPITEAERGENYVITWRYNGPELDMPLVLKFEYQTAKEEQEPVAPEFEYPAVKKGTYNWTFNNIGVDYIDKGPVDRWKVSLILGDQVVAEKRSFTWQAMEGS